MGTPSATHSSVQFPLYRALWHFLGCRGRDCAPPQEAMRWGDGTLSPLASFAVTIC